MNRVGSALLITLPVSVYDQWAAFRRKVEEQSAKLSEVASRDYGYPGFGLDSEVPDGGPERHDLNWTTTSSGRHRPLTRAEWIVCGEDVKQFREAMIQVGMTLQEAFNKPTCRTWFNFADRVDKLKSKLDSEVCSQHPDWTEFSRVFYGDRLEKNQELRASVDLAAVAKAVGHPL